MAELTMTTFNSSFPSMASADNVRSEMGNRNNSTRLFSGLEREGRLLQRR